MSGKVVQSEREVQDSKVTRNQAIELLRIMSAFGIVAYHGGAPFRELAYAGLVIFLILAPATDLRFNWNRARSISQLAQTLLVPWGFWWVIYGGLNLVRQNGFLANQSPLTGLLYGTSAHLWFLPFIFAVLVLLNAAKTRMHPKALFYVATLAAAICFGTVAIWRVPSLTLPLPLPQWSHALPAIFIGIALGLSGRAGRAVNPARLILGGALFIALAARLDGVGITYTVGIGLTLVAMSRFAERISVRWNVQPIADCMLGVFLTHILWLQILGQFLKPGTYLTVTLAFAAALSATFAVRHIAPISRKVFG